MGTPVDLYIYPGMAIKFDVLSKITMTPLGPNDVIPPGAIVVPPVAPSAPAATTVPVVHLAAAEVMANLKATTDLAAQAVADSVKAQEAAYLAAAPVYSVGPTGQTSGPK